MVDSRHRRTGQKSQARAWTGLLSSCLESRPAQATVSVNKHTQHPPSHRRYSAVSPRTRQRGTTPFRFPIRVGRSVCRPTMTTADCDHCPAIFCPNCNHQCLLCTRCVSDFVHPVPCTYCGCTTQRIRPLPRRQPRTSTLQATHSLLHFRALVVEFRVYSCCTGMPNLCGWVTDWTLYPLSSQGSFLRAVSALLLWNFRRMSEKDLADVRAVDLAMNMP